jgi:hypothetical protein
MEQREPTVRKTQKPGDDWGLVGRAMERFERPFRRAIEDYGAADPATERRLKSVVFWVVSVVVLAGVVFVALRDSSPLGVALALLPAVGLVVELVSEGRRRIASRRQRRVDAPHDPFALR